MALMLFFLFGPLPAFGIEGSPTLPTTLENQPIFLATPTTSEKITIPYDEQVTALVFTHNRLCRAQDPVIPLKPPRPMTNNTFERILPMCSLSKSEHTCMTRDTPDKFARALNTTYMYMYMYLYKSTAPNFVRWDSAYSCTYKKGNHIFEHCCPAFNRLKSKKKSRRSQKKGHCNSMDGKAKLQSADGKKKNETIAAQQPSSCGWIQNPLESFILFLSLRHSFKGLKSLLVWMIRLLPKKISDRLHVPAGDVPYCTAVVQHSSEHSCSIDRLSPSAQTADSRVSSQPTAGAADVCTSSGGTTTNVIRPTVALKDAESHQKNTQNDYECKYEMVAQQFEHSNQNEPISASEQKTPTSDNCSSDTPTATESTLPCSDSATSSSGEWTQSESNDTGQTHLFNSQSATNLTTTSGYVSKDISMTDEQKQPSNIVPCNKINSNDDHSKLLQPVVECTEEGSESEPYILPVATRDTPQVAEETSIPPSSEMVCLVQTSIPVDDGEDDKDTETIKWAVPVEANNRNHDNRNPRKPPDLSSDRSFETPKQENQGFLELNNHQVQPYMYSYVYIHSSPPDTKTCLPPVYKFESVNVESPDPVELVRFEE